MKNCLFALTIGLFAIGCNGGTGSGPSQPKGIPVIESAVIDSPPPSPVGDPDYQRDRGGSVPSDSIIGRTGYNWRQLDSIEKQKWGPVEHTPGKGVGKPHPPK